MDQAPQAVDAPAQSSAVRIAQWAVALACLGWTPPTEIAAQQTAPVIGGYQLDVWRAQDGVRLAFTSNLVQASDGYLWLSTQSGLARFDGVRFQVFDGTNTPVLRGRPNLQTYPLIEDSHRTLWIGTDIGLLTYDRGTFSSLTPDSTFATDLLNDAVTDSSGQLWAITRLGRLYRASRDAGLVRVRGGNASAVGSTMTVDAFGNVWIAAGARGVYRVQGDSIFRVSFPPDARIHEVNRIYATADSSLWVGTASSIAQWKHGRIREIPLPAGPKLRSVSRLVTGPDGELWIGTEGAGLYRFDGRKFMHVSRQDGLSDDRVIDIIVDRSRNVWVATRDGLNRLRPVPFALFTVRTGLPTELPGAIIRDRSGVVWLAPPTGGLFHGRIVNGRAMFSARDISGASDRITVLARGRDSSVWAGRLSGSVTRFSNGIADRRPIMTGLPPVTDLLEDSAGTLWIGTWHGLIRWEAGRSRVLTPQDGLPDDAIHRLFRDASGSLWVATQSGIARASNDERRFTALLVPDGGAVRAAVLFEAPAGTLWAGSANGLARISGGRPVLITTAQGLPENWVGAAEQDDTGNLWLGQLGGLTRVRLSDLIAVADGRARTLTTATSYPSLDGLPGGDPTAWPHPWSFRDPSGILWFALGHGIAVVDPSRVVDAARAPMVTIEQILVDGVAVPPAETVRIGAAAQRVEVRYTGIDLANGPGVRFRYRLDGFDTAWTDAGAQRAASYTRLAAGQYRFRVEARAGNGRWSPSQASTGIEVLASWYRRPVFLAALGAGLALALWASHRARLRTRSMAVREERSRLAREIHDSLLQGFVGITLHLQAVSTRLSLPPDKQRLLDGVLELIDRTLKQARETVWDIRESDRDEALSAGCAAAAERIFAGSGVVVRIVQRGRARGLSPSVRTACLRIVEEALRNVRSHAEATEVRVDLEYGWRGLHVSVADNGKGDAVDLEQRRPGHWGILGMRERASQMGASVSFQSAPGRGTRVSLTAPYRNGVFSRPGRRDGRD